MLARIPWAALTAGSLSAAAFAYACGIAPSGDCGDNGTCPPDAAEVDSHQPLDAGVGEDVSNGRDTGMGTDAAGTDAGLDSGTDGDGGDGFVCDPTKDPKSEPCVLDESYGVFVAPSASGGDDVAGDGTKAKPFATIGKALQRLNGRARVYVCNGTYAEQVTLTVVASLYGGLACPGSDDGAAWTYVGGLASVTSPTPDYAIKIESIPSKISIEDMAFTAPSAHGQDFAGNGLSSIAALANASTVDLTRVVLTAGSGTNAAAGADGFTVPNYAGSIAPGGLPGAAPDSGGSGGGAGGSNTCKNGDVSTGGAGGAAGSATGGMTGGNGQPGLANPAAMTMPGGGLGGFGGISSCGLDALSGANGAAGAKGSAAATYGSLSSSGWLPSAGGGAQTGGPGQGGGGGGGLATVGGGGGAAGGCGGTGGAGGRGGGGSIALASVDSTLKLDLCTLTSGAAGNGGQGGAGDIGQGGGSTPNSVMTCGGAPGGNGAGGSGAAGGTGGISVGILYTGTPPAYDGNTVATRGTAGTGGPHGTKGGGGSAPPAAGNAGTDGDDGHPGIAQAVLALGP